MASSAPSSPVGIGNPPQVPPSGNGDTEATAQYTTAFAKDTSQEHFTVYCQLDSVKWLRRTRSEGLEYKVCGYTVYKASGQTYRPDASTGSVDPDAFYNQLAEVQRAEKALENAGQPVGHEESLAADANENGPAGDEKSEAAYSGSSESGGSGDVFDKPEIF